MSRPTYMMMKSGFTTNSNFFSVVPNAMRLQQFPTYVRKSDSLKLNLTVTGGISRVGEETGTSKFFDSSKQSSSNSSCEREHLRCTSGRKTQGKPQEALNYLFRSFLEYMESSQSSWSFDNLGRRTLTVKNLPKDLPKERSEWGRSNVIHFSSRINDQGENGVCKHGKKGKNSSRVLLLKNFLGERLRCIRERSEVKSVRRSDEEAERRGNIRRVVAAVAAIVVFSQGGGESAMAFGWFGNPPAVEKDPVEPFTLYGSIFKKYLIEDVVEGRIVGRKKGFTASACVNALDASKETPELQGVPAGLKVTSIGEPSCSKGEGHTREESCMPPCRKACQAAVARHATDVKHDTGYILDRSDISKATDNCSSQCFNECTKPGKSISFVFPFRPH